LRVTIADLDVGNLHSLNKALQHLGAETVVTADPDRWLDADVLVLPGDGAFRGVAAQVAPRRQALAQRVRARPTLGVCIGMQLLFASSAEAPDSAGLGVLPGRVERLPAARLPHMGWNTVEHRGDDLFVAVPSGAHFYFVHSYAPLEAEAAVGWCDYEGTFAAAVRAGPASYAVQFHPEKSSRWGLELLDNFLAIAEEAL